MIFVRIGFKLSRSFTTSKLLPNKIGMDAPHYDLVQRVFQTRKLSSLIISKNMELISQEKKKTQVMNLKLSTPQDKPLVVMLSWLMAKRKHVYKYANFYLDQGFDVLNISVSPWQILWPAKGTQIVAGDILKFIDINRSYGPLLLHGFSVGGYVWGEVLVKIAQDLERYQHIIDKTAGQIWDSLADITEIPVGLPSAVFPRNPVLQNTLRQYVLYHMKAFDKVATCHYIRSSQMFHTNPIKSPALVFLSKTDPIGAESSNQRARESWENMGMKVYWKCFDNSPHVGHLYKYPKEYLTELYMFLDNLGLVANKERIQAKL